MELHLTLLVLLAALMHAVWNTFIKVSDDPLVELALVNLASAVIAACAIPWVGVPDPASWPYMFASIVIHSAYYYLLLQAYCVGDLSQVYPLARGVSPLVVALFSGVVAGEVLTTGQVAGVLIVSISITSLAWNGRWLQPHETKPIVLAVATGFVIGAYTLSDGTGARLSNNALAYIAWLFTLDCLPLLTVAAIRRRRSLGQVFRNQWRTGIFGGILAIGAYGLVIWALSLGAMAPVAALRETSVVIAAVIGTVFLRERFGRRRMLAAVGVAVGVITLRIAG
ncbi:MAG: EamA family transporter [Acidiferrobacterales bacterium]